MPRTYSSRPQKRKRLESVEPSEPSKSSSPPSSPYHRKMKRPLFSRTPKVGNGSSDSENHYSVLKKPRKFTQLTLDVGLSSTITCPDCGMSYTPSQATDAALHAKHHARHAASTRTPPELSISLCCSLLDIQQNNVVWATGERAIVRVTRRDTATARKVAERMLRAATGDLGAIDISSTKLWAEYQQLTGTSRIGQYQLFLSLRGRSCVGILLAECISTGNKVTNAGYPLKFDDNSTYPAEVGVSRIWTHHSERKTGIASRLLDTVRKSFWPVHIIPKEKIAFSQPTEQGASLARKWFQKEDNWLIYRD